MQQSFIVKVFLLIGLSFLLLFTQVNAIDSPFAGWSLSVGENYNYATSEINTSVNYFNPDGSSPGLIAGTNTVTQLNHEFSPEAQLAYNFVNEQNYYFAIKAFIATQKKDTEQQVYNYVANSGSGIEFYEVLALQNKSNLNYGLIIAPGYIFLDDNLLYFNIGVQERSIKFAATSYLETTIPINPLSLQKNANTLLMQYGVGWQHAFNSVLAVFAEYDFYYANTINLQQNDLGDFAPNRVEQYRIDFNNHQIMAGITWHF